MFEGFYILGSTGFCTEIELKNADLWLSFIDKQIEVENEFSHEYNVYTIEDLIDLELTLTPTAKKLIL